MQSFHTMVDMYCCFELWELTGEMCKLPEGDVMEVGVRRGGTGCLIAKKCQLAGVAATVYRCDNFEGLVKADECDTHWADGDLSDASELAVASLAKRMGLRN